VQKLTVCAALARGETGKSSGSCGVQCSCSAMDSDDQTPERDKWLLVCDERSQLVSVVNSET